MKVYFQLLIFIAFYAFSVTSYGQNPNPSATLDAFIEGEMSLENIPGATTLIVKDGEIVWVESYGFADIDNSINVEDTTVFLLASISKVFTGTALMQLEENGTLDLDEDINNYLPFDVDIPGFVSDSITFRDLMTHTSSIIDGAAMDGYYGYPDPTITLAQCVQRYFDVSGSDYSATQNFSTNAPGTTYSYSNMATALAGYLVEVVSGIDFAEYCNQNIFEPLCMNHTGWHMSDFDTNEVARPYQFVGGNYQPYAHYGFADYPDGQLRSDITDIANFLIAYLQDGSFNASSILNSASIAEMLTLQVPGIENTQGLNWYTEELFTATQIVTVWGHNGGESGVSTDFYMDKANNIAIAVLTNGEGDNLYICDELLDYGMSLTATGVGNPNCGQVGISEIDDYFAIFPNPTNDIIHVGNTVKSVSVIDITGKVMNTINVKNGKINLSKYPKGTYLLNLKDSDGLIHKKQIIVD
jgi:CubicO group peptidase (beta-lactamase class C family)